MNFQRQNNQNCCCNAANTPKQPENIALSTCLKSCTCLTQLFSQAKSGRLYESATEPYSISTSCNLVYCLRNPDTYNITVYPSKLSCSNYSTTPVRITTYYYATFAPEKASCINSINANMYVDCTCKSKASLTCSSGVPICNGYAMRTLITSGYATGEFNMEGATVLSPGSCVLYEIVPLHCKETALVDFYISWWEVCNFEELIR